MEELGQQHYLSISKNQININYNSNPGDLSGFFYICDSKKSEYGSLQHSCAGTPRLRLSGAFIGGCIPGSIAGNDVWLQWQHFKSFAKSHIIYNDFFPRTVFGGNHHAGLNIFKRSRYGRSNEKRRPEIPISRTSFLYVNRSSINDDYQ